MYTIKQKTIQKAFRLPVELVNQVEEYAKANYLDVTTVLKIALVEYLNKVKANSNNEDSTTSGS